jgi:hypothetical protein
LSRRSLAPVFAVALGLSLWGLARTARAEPVVVDRVVVRFIAPETGGVRSRSRPGSKRWPILIAFRATRARTATATYGLRSSGTSPRRCSPRPTSIRSPPMPS